MSSARPTLYIISISTCETKNNSFLYEYMKDPITIYYNKSQIDGGYKKICEDIVNYNEEIKENNRARSAKLRIVEKNGGIFDEMISDNTYVSSIKFVKLKNERRSK